MHSFAHVWAWVKKVPRGRVVTYGQLSILIERRLTPVGVGWALSAAPPDVPWHRVVNAKGGISTKDDRQRALLSKERVRFGEDGCVELARYQWQPRPRPRAAQK